MQLQASNNNQLSAPAQQKPRVEEKHLKNARLAHKDTFETLRVWAASPYNREKISNLLATSTDSLLSEDLKIPDPLQKELFVVPPLEHPTADYVTNVIEQCAGLYLMLVLLPTKELDLVGLLDDMEWGVLNRSLKADATRVAAFECFLNEKEREGIDAFFT